MRGRLVAVHRTVSKVKNFKGFPYTILINLLSYYLSDNMLSIFSSSLFLLVLNHSSFVCLFFICIHF